MATLDRPVRPSQPVEVERGGVWVPAHLTWWQQRAGAWHGHVTRYGPGSLSYVEWYPAGRIRPLAEREAGAVAES